ERRQRERALWPGHGDGDLIGDQQGAGAGEGGQGRRDAKPPGEAITRGSGTLAGCERDLAADLGEGRARQKRGAGVALYAHDAAQPRREDLDERREGHGQYGEGDEDFDEGEAARARGSVRPRP